MFPQWNFVRCFVLIGILVQLTTSDEAKIFPIDVETTHPVPDTDVEDTVAHNVESIAAEYRTAKTPHFDEKSITSNIPGILIENNSSAACSNISLNLQNIFKFNLCFFLQLKDEPSNREQNNTIIEIWRNNKTIFEIQSSRLDNLIINFGGLIHVHPIDHASLKFDDWTRICVAVNDYIEEIYVNINYTEKFTYPVNLDDFLEQATVNITYTEPEYYDSNQSSNIGPNTDSKETSASMCVGSYNSRKSSIVGSMVGLTLNPYRLTYDPCMFNKGKNIFTPDYLLVNPEFDVGDVKTVVYDQTGTSELSAIPKFGCPRPGVGKNVVLRVRILLGGAPSRNLLTPKVE